METLLHEGVRPQTGLVSLVVLCAAALSGLADPWGHPLPGGRALGTPPPRVSLPPTSHCWFMIWGSFPDVAPTQPLGRGQGESRGRQAPGWKVAGVVKGAYTQAALGRTRGSLHPPARSSKAYRSLA